ncbi:cytoskeletal protein binding protein, partial [Tulasnella sp. 408]
MAVFRDVVQAARDYVGTTDDEVTVLQGRLLYLLEQFYDGWAKVQVHTSQYFLFSPRVGLIPSAYIEPAPPVYRAIAVYDYQANGGELSMKKKDTMNVYFQEGGMALVKIDRKDAFSQSAVGYVPVHYIKPGEGNVELQVHTTAAAARAGGIRSLIEVSTTAVLCDVMKATYDYAATADDEVTVAEDQLLYLLENPEEKYWAKVRVHAPPYSVSPTRVGLVPSSYIEPAPPMYRAIALYDYEADREGEISMKENETMNVYLEEDGWILVKIDRKDTVRGPAVGFVPANYIEKVGGDVESSADPSEEVFKDHTTAAAAARAGGIIAVPLYDFEAEGDDELTVKEGERLTILDKEDDEWWKCRNWTGNEGIVPASYLEIESADEADGDAAAEVAAWRKLRDDAAAIAAKAHRLVEESRRKREQVAREERIRQERDEIKTIKAEALRQREEKNYAREALLRGVDAMVQAGSKSSTGEVTKNSAPFDSLLKFERPPADITKIMSEPKGAEVESKVTAQRAPLPDPFSDLSSWAAGLPESTSSKKLESMALIDDIGLGITWLSPMPVKLNGNFCDVFEGMHVEVGKVAVKRPRIGSAGSDDMVVR